MIKVALGSLVGTHGMWRRPFICVVATTSPCLFSTGSAQLRWCAFDHDWPTVDLRSHQMAALAASLAYTLLKDDSPLVVHLGCVEFSRLGCLASRWFVVSDFAVREMRKECACMPALSFALGVCLPDHRHADRLFLMWVPLPIGDSFGLATNTTPTRSETSGGPGGTGPTRTTFSPPPCRITPFR